MIYTLFGKKNFVKRTYPGVGFNPIANPIPNLTII